MIEVEALDFARQLEIEDFKASNLKSENIYFSISIFSKTPKLSFDVFLLQFYFLKNVFQIIIT